MRILKITRKVIRIKLTLLVLAIMPIAVFTLLTSKSGFIAGIRSMVVLSGSMIPAIPTGSVVYILPDTLYHVGDVISFTNKSGATVTHRVKRITSEDGSIVYQTKGDANKITDVDLVPQSKILGKSIFSLPYLGYAVNWLKTPSGFLIAIIVPTLILIALELWAIKAEIERSVEERVKKQMQLV